MRRQFISREREREQKKSPELRADKSRSEAAMLRATWVSAFCALLTVFATMLLAYLAYRQERATFSSNLYTKQIELAGDLAIKNGRLERDFSWANKRVTSLHEKKLTVGGPTIGEVSSRLDDFRRSAETYAFVVPTGQQTKLDNLIEQSLSCQLALRDIWDNGDSDLRDCDFLFQQTRGLTACARSVLSTEGLLTDQSMDKCLSKWVPSPPSYVKTDVDLN